MNTNLIFGQNNINETFSSLGLRDELIDKFRGSLPKEGILPYLSGKNGDTSGQERASDLIGKTENFEKEGPEITFVHRSSPINNNFLSLQRWEGLVIEVHKNSFLARLSDLTEDSPDEHAEFPVEEISDSERPLIKPGAIFYWSIGYFEKNGNRKRESVIRFRQIPAWRKEELDNAKDEVEIIKESIGWK